MVITAASASSPDPTKDILGHPRGLAYIAFTEAWERFSFYGMQALLMLYMTGRLLKPEVVGQVWGFDGFRRALESVTGPLSTQALAAQIFGIYVSLVYFGPIVGGLVGDRLIGRTRAVVLGGVLLALGHLAMASQAAFLPAVSLLIIGAGLLKGNLAAQVGALYPENDRRRDGGYTVYFTAINVGAFLAPLVCGTLGELYGWHYGFGVAGIGMLVGLAIYLRGAHHLNDQPVRRRTASVALGRHDWGTVAALCGLIALTSVFWTVQSQIWNTYPIWVRDHVDLRIGWGLSVPVTWFQSLDSLTVLLLAPVAIAFWRSTAKRKVEPSDITKVALGCALYGLACVLLSLGQWTAGAGKVSILWPVLFHFVVGMGYLFSAPVALALVSRAAPASVNAMMVGGYYLGLFVAGIFSGWLGRFYEPLHPPLFWLLHAAIGMVGALVLLGVRRRLGLWLGPDPTELARQA
jgi:POT family proton-dependent oligopeptide transporter